jgi:hypothetical protein
LGGKCAWRRGGDKEEKGSIRRAVLHLPMKPTLTVSLSPAYVQHKAYHSFWWQGFTRVFGDVAVGCESAPRGVRMDAFSEGTWESGGCTEPLHELKRARKSRTTQTRVVCSSLQMHLFLCFSVHLWFLTDAIHSRRADTPISLESCNDKVGNRQCVTGTQPQWASGSWEEGVIKGAWSP